MLIFENLKISLDSLRANPIRSTLTLLGISIGIAAVLYVVVLGEVTKASIEKKLQSLGSNILLIRPGASHLRGIGTSASVINLTWDDARLLESKSEVIQVTVPSYSGAAAAEFRDTNWHGRVTGTTPQYAPINNCELAAGQFFTDRDLTERRRVCVLGNTVRKDLFGETEPVGQTVLINSHRFEVVGLLELKGESWGSPDEQIFVPLTVAQSRLFGVDYINMIMAQLRSSADYDEALFDVESLLRQSHRLREDQDNDFNVTRQDFFLTTIQETNTEIANFIILIALVSLLVGGIGIANVMLVSVTERIREIGTRRAIGATRGMILLQFVFEAMTLGSIGGFLGILGGVIINLWVVKGSWIIPWYWIGNSLLICIGIGLIAGLYPAYRAARMDVIEALRYE